MSISINNLINYFNNDDNDENYINSDKYNILEKDSTENFSKIKKFNDIFGDYVIRYGIGNEDNSFLYSLLFLLDNEFIIFLDKNQKEYVNTLKKRLYNEVTEKNLLKKLKLSKNGWNKKNILKMLKDDKINNNYIYYIASYFNINIFIIDIEKNKIFPFYNDEKFIKYKSNIILSYYNEIYEPIIYEDNDKNFSYNSDILNKILSSDKLEIPYVGFTKKIIIKDFEVDNNISIINEIEEKKELKEEKKELKEEKNDIDNIPIYKINEIDIQYELNTVSEDYNTETNLIENNYSTYTIDELIKSYKKPELINICKSLNIPYSNKNKLLLAKEILKKK